MINGCKRTTAWILLVASLLQNCQCGIPPIPRPTFDFTAQLDKSELTLEDGVDTPPVKLTVNITSTNDLAKSLGYKCTITLAERAKGPKGALAYLDKAGKPTTAFILQPVQEGENIFLYTQKDPGTHPITVTVHVDDQNDVNNKLQKEQKLSLQVHKIPTPDTSGGVGAPGGTSGPAAGASAKAKAKAAPSTPGFNSGGGAPASAKANAKAKAKTAIEIGVTLPGRATWGDEGRFPGASQNSASNEDDLERVYTLGTSDSRFGVSRRATGSEDGLATPAEHLVADISQGDENTESISSFMPERVDWTNPPIATGSEDGLATPAEHLVADISQGDENTESISSFMPERVDWTNPPIATRSEDGLATPAEQLVAGISQGDENTESISSFMPERVDWTNPIATRSEDGLATPAEHLVADISQGDENTESISSFMPERVDWTNPPIATRSEDGLATPAEQLVAGISQGDEKNRIY